MNSDYDGTRIKHSGVQNNIANLKTAIANLENPVSKEVVGEAMVALRSLPSASYAYRFGEFAYTDMVNMTNGTEKDQKGRNIPTNNWGYNNLIPAPTSESGAEDFWQASQLIMDKADYDPAERAVGDACSLSAADYASAVVILKEALADMEDKFNKYFDDEQIGIYEMIYSLGERPTS